MPGKINTKLRHFCENYLPDTQYLIYPDDTFKKYWDFIIVL